MKRQRWMQVILVASTFVSGAVITASTARAADWPQWGGSDPGRNMVSAERDLPESFKARSPTENVRWMATLGGAIQGNPTVAGGRVFVGTDDVMLEDDARFHRTHGG